MVRYCLMIVCMAMTLINSHAVTGEEIMNDAAMRYQAAKSISAQFVVHENGSDVSGNIVIAGDRFRLDTPAIKVWYDGRTQWSYMPETNEVNITEPTADELQQVNPFAIVSAFRQAYKATLQSGSANEYNVKLTPLSSNASSVTSVTLVLNRRTLYPSEIEITSRDNNSMRITVKNVSTGNVLPIKEFTFDAAKFPKTEIVDLR